MNRTKLKGGSLSGTYLISDGGERFVRKEVSLLVNREYGFRRWYSQLKRLQRYSVQFPGMFPDVFAYGKEGDSAYFDMEFVEGSVTAHDFVTGADSLMVESFAHELISCMSLMHNTMIKSSSGSMALYIHEEIDRSLEHCMTNEKFRDFIKHDTVVFNGEEVPSLMSRLDDYRDALMEYGDHPETFTHGNLTLENILYVPKSGRVVFIDPYELFPDCSATFMEICRREGVVYIKAPNNYYQEPGSFDSSMKLGTTMSWVFHNCAKRRGTKYFGFLDHDCFLLRDFDIVPYLDSKGMYGRVSRSVMSPPAFNLHVTVNFFRYDFVKDHPLDFRASHKYYLDTAGANYDVLYHAFDPAEYDLHLITYRFDEIDVNRKDSVQHYEIIDNVWFHMAASTHDQLVGDGAFKLIYAKGLLDGRLLKFD